MTMKDDIKAQLIANLEELVDPFMISRDFKRARRSLVYKRSIGDTKQQIDVNLEMHPRDRPDSVAALYPFMEVRIPEVDKILKDMVGDDRGLLEGITGGTSKQPIGFTSGKAHPGRWFIFQADSVPGAVEDMQGFLKKWAMPLLDNYATPEDILTEDEKENPRVNHDRAQVLRVVASAIACERSSYARNRMDKAFSGAGARRRYQKVFDYIEKFA
jgi:hypothetical protein